MILPALNQSAAGSKPEGAHDEREAARAIREMFTAVAPRYDLLNHLLSFNVDRLWWKRAAANFTDLLRAPGASALDLCCGTADMAMALRRKCPTAAIFGVDFSHAMLTLAARKAGDRIRLLEADALCLPFAGESFDLVISAFGFRNLANYDTGLHEIFRVLRPDGEVGILDFGEPRGILGKIYRVYFRRVLPVIGTAISGVRGPYSYLPASVGRFPDPEAMLERMRAAGFHEASWTPYTFGIAGLYRGAKR